MINRVVLAVALCLPMSVFAYSKGGVSKDSLKKDLTGELSTLMQDNPFIAQMDSMMATIAFEQYGTEKSFYDSSMLNQCWSNIVPMDANLIRERLDSINELTPFDLTYNDRVHAFINLYLNKRPQVSSKVMGLSAFYFPLFEEILAKNDLPLEFKYLAVVESALNGKARSRAGAMGLWQFMYSTGKIYGLRETSYIDDRMDPIKATEAACAYFKDLYKIYGDWDLVMAAYNCGPGNVNKAIRRSGGRKGYWEIYRYLPRETRGYVPAFIAVNYMMNFGKSHNIYPQKPLSTYFENDTVHVNRKLYFKQLARELETDRELLEFLNPQYKYGIIPFDGKTHVLKLPLDMVAKWVLNEEELTERASVVQGETEPVFAYQEVRKVHYVRKGEYLGKIARRYGCSVGQIQRWNRLRGTNIRVGQRLVVFSRERVMIEGKPIQQEQLAEKSEEVKTNTEEAQQKDDDFIFYTIQKGDTLWDIAKAKGITLDTLRQFNNNLNHYRLKPGDKIIVGVQG